MKGSISKENKVIQYLYNEIRNQEKTNIEQRMLQDYIFRKKIETLAKIKAHAEKAEVSPSEKIVNLILKYGKQSQLPKDRTYLDKTSTH